MGCPHIAEAPQSGPCMCPTNLRPALPSVAILQTVGSFTWLLSFLEVSLRSAPYMSPRLAQLFPLSSRRFSIPLSISSSWGPGQQQLLTSGARLGTQTRRAAPFSCPGPFPLREWSMRKLEPRQLLLGRTPGVEEAIVSASRSTQV